MMTMLVIVMVQFKVPTIHQTTLYIIKEEEDDVIVKTTIEANMEAVEEEVEVTTITIVGPNIIHVHGRDHTNKHHTYGEDNSHGQFHLALTPTSNCARPPSNRSPGTTRNRSPKSLLSLPRVYCLLPIIYHSRVINLKQTHFSH